MSYTNESWLLIGRWVSLGVSRCLLIDREIEVDRGESPDALTKARDLDVLEDRFRSVYKCVTETSHESGVTSHESGVTALITNSPERSCKTC